MVAPSIFSPHPPGNELGALLGWWLVTQHQARHPSSTATLHLLASTVSSKFLATLAATHPRLTFTETLTGFKHMGNVSDRLRREGDTVIFAFEEAIGFMCGDAVLDKVGGALQNIYRVCLVVS